MVVAVMAVNLALGALSKVSCLSPTSNATALRACYNDIQFIFVNRGLALHIFPYVHGTYSVAQGAVALGHGEVEYPTLMGLVAWLTALPTTSQYSYFAINIVLLALFGALSAWLLAKIAGWRALVFAATPGLALYAYLNWDLIPVACAVGGVYLWARRRPIWAAAALSVGADFKFWPALLLLPLVAELLADRRRRCAVGVVGVAASCAAVANLPFLVANPRGWFAPFAFQAARQVDIGTNNLWYWAGRSLGTSTVDVLSLLLSAAGAALVLYWAWLTTKRTGVFPFVQASAMMVFWYLLCSKDFNTQYALWALPFFAMLRLRYHLWLQFAASNALLYILWFLVPDQGAPMAFSVFWRSVVLLVAIRAATRAEPVGLLAPGTGGAQTGHRHDGRQLQGRGPVAGRGPAATPDGTALLGGAL